MAVATKRLPKRHAPLLRLLDAKRAQLLAHLREHREALLAERVPEDTEGLASRTLLEDLAVGTLQRDQKLLGEVEAALQRLQEDSYGICAVCGEEIPQRRLQAIPWTRHCLKCAELALSEAEGRRQAHWRN